MLQGFHDRKLTA